MIDPTDLFLEKVAEDPPDKEDEPLDPIDPGEAAVIGATAISGNVLARAASFLGNTYLASLATDDAVTAPRHLPVDRAKYPSEFTEKGFRFLNEQASGRAKNLREPILGGLFKVSPLPLKMDQETVEGMVGSMSALEERIRKTDGVVRSFIDKYKLPEKGVRIGFSSGSVGGSLLGPHYDPASKRVALPRYSKEIALHELGHAADYTKGLGKVRKWTDPLIAKGTMAALPIALVAGDEIKKLMPGTIDDRAIEFMQENAPQIMAGTIAATTLYPEAKATGLALRHIAEKEGRPAAQAAFRKLAPAYGTYLLSAIPAIAGMALARKFMRQAREVNKAEAEAREKTASFLGSVGKNYKHMLRAGLEDMSHIGREIAETTSELARKPDSLKRVGDAAKAVGTDPVFVHGAVTSAIPASLAALYLYSTKPGQVARDRLEKDHIRRMGASPIIMSRTDEEWREKNPKLYAGLVAAGAAMAGGVISKLVMDLGRVI